MIKKLISLYKKEIATKQQAIEWIKELKKGDGFLEITNIKGQLYQPMHRQGAIQVLTHLFNIKEEEVKENE